MTPFTRAAVAWLSAAFTYVASEAIAAEAFRPTYSYTRNFISDLGVADHSPLAWLMNGAFAMQGVLFLVAAALTRRAGALLAFAVANAVGNVLIALFHSGSTTHAVGAVLAIVGGNAAILAGSSIIGGWHRRASFVLGGFGLVSFGVFVISLHGAVPGVAERCSVYSITAWELITGTWLLSRRPTP